jgi:hypothetical protein
MPSAIPSPEKADFLTRRALVLLTLTRTAEARELMERAHAFRPGWESVPRFAEIHVAPMAPASLVSLVAGLTEPHWTMIASSP